MRFYSEVERCVCQMALSYVRSSVFMMKLHFGLISRDDSLHEASIHVCGKRGRGASQSD